MDAVLAERMGDGTHIATLINFWIVRIFALALFGISIVQLEIHCKNIRNIQW